MSEIFQPFQVDAAKGIAVDSDRLHAAGQRLITLLLTGPGERVMRPSYGVGASAQVFETSDRTVSPDLVNQLHSQAQLWEPGAGVLGITGHSDPSQPGVAFLDISYTHQDDRVPRTIRVAANGTQVSIA